MLALASVLRHSQCWAHLARGRDGMYMQTKYRTQKTRFAYMVLGQKQLSPGQGSSTIVVVPQQMSKTLTWKHTAVSPTPPYGREIGLCLWSLFFLIENRLATFLVNKQAPRCWTHFGVQEASPVRNWFPRGSKQNTPHTCCGGVGSDQ